MLSNIDKAIIIFVSMLFGESQYAGFATGGASKESHPTAIATAGRHEEWTGVTFAVTAAGLSNPGYGRYRRFQMLQTFRLDFPRHRFVTAAGLANPTIRRETR